jgi:Zn-dependent hydrolases, including glyoxylases
MNNEDNAAKDFSRRNFIKKTAIGTAGVASAVIASNLNINGASAETNDTSGMKMYFLQNGWLECDENGMVLNKVKGTIKDKSPTHKWIKIPVWCVAINHPQKGWILFDTGADPNGMKGAWPAATTDSYPYYYNNDQLLINQLSLIGLKPSDIKTVVLSHGHFDHAGNLSLFTNADVYWSKADYDYADAGLKNATGLAFGGFMRADHNAPVKSLQMVTTDFALAPGIEVINVPGHTPGVLGLVIHLQSGTYILPSDAVYTPENYGLPAKLAGSFYDNLSFIKSIEKIHELEKYYNAKVMFSHDMEVYQTFKFAPDYYE